MIVRTKHSFIKAWEYLLLVMANPRSFPFFVIQVLKGVHLGELIKLTRHKLWLESLNICTIIDVGAHTGEFSLAINAILPERKIYCFEPLEDCFNALNRKLMQFTKNSEAFCVALGSNEEMVTFHRSVFSKSSSILQMGNLHKQSFPWSESCKDITVQLRTLDGCLDGKSITPKTLLKIDVQGYELEVLKGASRILDSTDYILVETSIQQLYEGQVYFHDVYNYLSGRGFEYAGNIEQLLSPLDSSILQVDSLFIRHPGKTSLQN